MPFTVAWTPEAREQYDALRNAGLTARAGGQRKGKTKSSRQEGLFRQVAKAVDLLLSNPKHPSLATHPYASLEHPFDSSKKVFEAYVQNKTPNAYRIFWCYGPDKRQITIIAITPHP